MRASQDIGLDAPPRSRRSSAVSQILRKISLSMDAEPADWDLSDEGDVEQHFRLRVAANRELRCRAYALAHRVYSESGLAPSDRNMIVSKFDGHPQTLTILVEDAHGRGAATVSVVVDSSMGLPADEIYHAELQQLRDAGRLLAEVTRLAIAPEYKHSRTLLVRLFNLVYVYARRIAGADDFVIEVHPRHAAYYRRLLLFNAYGPERPCPRVQNSMSVLLRLNFSESDQVIRRCAGKRAEAAVSGERSLYPSFYSWLEEGAVAEFIARQRHPMSTADAAHFGLVEFNVQHDLG